MPTLVESALKHCKACNRDLPVESFAKDRTKKDGRCNTCRTCKGAYKSEWQKRNRERANGYSKKHYEKHPKYQRQTDAQRVAKTIAQRKIREIREYWRRLELENRTRACAQCGCVIHDWKNKRFCEGCRNARDKESSVRTKSTEHYKEMRRVRERISLRLKYRTNARYNLSKKFRLALSDTVKGKQGRRSFDLLPYTVEQLERRLRATMPAGCTWDDFIAGRLHIDHIIPIAAHNFATPDDPDFLRCWALSNLQLLKGSDNCRKGACVNHEFQPMLSYTCDNSSGPAWR